MTTRTWESGFIWLAAGVLGLLGAQEQAAGEDSPKPPLPGVVVEEVAEGSALARAGLQAGDLVLGWERLPAPPANPEGKQGEIASPFDWLWVKEEQAPRGTVKLSGKRDGELMVSVVKPGLWEANVRPRMSGTTLAAYLKGRELIDREQVEEGVSSWRQAAETARHDEDWPLRCWLLLRVGQVWAEARVWEKAEAAYERAWEEAREPKAQVVVREASGDALRDQREWDRSEQAYRSASEIRKASWGEGLGVGKNLNALGSLAYRRGDLTAEQAYYQQTLPIFEKLAPESPQLAGILSNLGAVTRETGDLDGAEIYCRRALAITERVAPNTLLLAGTLNNVGDVLYQRGDLPAAETYYQRALAIKQKLAPNSLQVAGTLSNLGNVAFDRGDPEVAEAFYQRALAIEQKLAPNSLQLASNLNNLGNAALDRGDPKAAEAFYQRALAIKQKLASNTLDVAVSLHNLGECAVETGDLEAAEAYYERASAISEKLAPNSLLLARTLTNMGILAFKRGDLEAAEGYYQRALAITEKLAPNSIQLAHTLRNSGNLAVERGDLETAEAYYLRVLSIVEKLAPAGLRLASTLVNLGNLALFRGDPEAAEAYYLRALGIEERLAPDSLAVANTLNNLGNVARRRGDLGAADAYYQRTLSITEKLAPNSLQQALSLINRGSVAVDRGERDAGEGYYQDALSITKKLAPNSLIMATALANLGTVASGRGDLDVAETYYRHALAITGQLVPDSLSLAETLRDLGKLVGRRDRLNEAADHMSRAIEALEGQISRLGISHERQGGYRAQRGNIYHETVVVLLELKRSEQAFYTLERFRARSLLAMLTERDLIFSTDIPEDLDKARKTLARRYDRILEQMGTLDSEKDQQQIVELSTQLRNLQRERDDLAARIRELSPRLADLQYPKALTLPQARDALDPGTVMLSYSVGEEETHIFVLTSDKGLVTVETLAIGDEKLRQKVNYFRRAIGRGTDPRSQFFQPVQDAGRELYEVLIGPVASSIDNSDRVLILPDGPLHMLPFSALIRESGEYLAEWKPVHFVLSATLYGQLRRTRPRPGDTPSMVAAFGDPVYPEIVRRENPDQIADVRVRAAVKRGLFDWEPLPHTRREVEGIAALYPAESVRSYLGEDATEERAKGLPRTTAVVHFAAHGHLDDRFPLNSAVVFTIPEGFPEDRENGLLQAWEIFERVRIDADLVVLSACESALGEERGGEGLIGLTRAFQYAGARTVVASLWNVADEVTAELMVRFYSHLRAGKSKDAALQAARIELIRDPIEVRKASGKLVQRNASAPYYWAAFQVIGDWR